MDGGVARQDESLQLPLFSALKWWCAHHDLAHDAFSQMNLQSDARALRGGWYLAYQAFMFVCSVWWALAESRQLPLSSMVKWLATHHDLAQPFSQMNVQSDSRAARGGSYLAYQSFMFVQCSCTQPSAGADAVGMTSEAAEAISEATSEAMSEAMSNRPSG